MLVVTASNKWMFVRLQKLGNNGCKLSLQYLLIFLKRLRNILEHWIIKFNHNTDPKKIMLSF